MRAESAQAGLKVSSMSNPQVETVTTSADKAKLAGAVLLLRLFN